MSGTSIQRDAYGHLLPGSRLNPGGRPRGVIEDVRALTLPSSWRRSSS